MSALTLDLGALEAMFNDSVVRLRHTALTAEIEQLTARARQGLNPEERQRLAELLAKKRPAQQFSIQNPIWQEKIVSEWPQRS